MDSHSKKGWWIYDCGCVATRPKNSNYYGSRWKVYRSTGFIMLKCKDCKRVYHYKLLQRDVTSMKREEEVEISG